MLVVPVRTEEDKFCPHMPYVHHLLSKVKTQDWRPHLHFEGGHGGLRQRGREAVKLNVFPFLPEPGLRALWGQEEEHPVLCLSHGMAAMVLSPTCGKLGGPQGSSVKVPCTTEQERRG